MRPRYVGGNRLRTSAEKILAAERNSFADRLNEQRPPSDPLSAIAPLLRVRQVEVQDLCRFASAWRSAHTAEAPSWAQFHMVTKGNCFLDMENGETFHLQAGSLLLLPRGDAHIVRSSHGGRSRAVPVRVEYNNAIRVKTNTLGSSDTELICGRLQFHGGVHTCAGLLTIAVTAFAQTGEHRSFSRLLEESACSKCTRSININSALERPEATAKAPARADLNSSSIIWTSLRMWPSARSEFTLSSTAAHFWWCATVRTSRRVR